MGAAHVRTIAEGLDGAHVAAVSDVDPSRAGAGAREGAGARVIDDPHALIADTAVDAVVVASYDATHEEFVLACIAAGKPVLCEKPLATTADACLRVVAAELTAGRRLVHLGFMRRYDPAYADVKERLDGGGGGDVLMVHFAHRNATAPPPATPPHRRRAPQLHVRDADHELRRARDRRRALAARAVDRGGDGARAALHQAG